MASKTTTRRKPATAAAEPVNVLDAFEDQLVQASDLLRGYEDGAAYAKVAFSGVLAAMFDAADEDTPALPADASKTAIRERRDGIRNRVLGYVLVKTGRSYTWASISDWIDAARVNATLPEHLQIQIGEDGKVSGTFNTWALRALGRVKDEDVRASLAEELASEGLTGQTAVEQAVREKNGEDAPKPVEPKAIPVMVEAVCKRVNKQAPKSVGAAATLAAQIGEDALTLADFGRLVFAATPSDPAVEDKDARNRKRLAVFRQAVEQLLFADEDALALADEDGITEDETH